MTATSNTPPAGGTPVVPLFHCRCGRAAVRYLGGKRRTFYCEEHGPTKLSDWTRLIPIPVEEYERAGRIVSLMPPLPARVAKLVDAFADGLREVLMQDFPAATMADGAAVEPLEREIVRLRAEVARLTVERDAAEEIANEAIELMPASPPRPSGSSLPVSPAVVEEDAERALALTERDLPQPGPESTPRAPSDAPSIPGPIMPETGAPVPLRRVPRPPKHKGFTVTRPAAPAPEPERVDVAQDTEQEPLPSRLPPGWVSFTATEVELYSLETLVQRIHAGPGAPGLSITRRGIKDFKSLSSVHRIAVLDALQYLSLAPQSLRMETLDNIDPPMLAIRANRQWRVMCTRPRPQHYAIERIVNRGNKTFYRHER
jgi:hypothetical protein